MTLMIFANIFFFLVVALHLYFAVLEILLWKSRASKVFKISQAQADATATMASNQGLYNLFLVMALVTGFFAKDPNVSHSFIVYGLACVIAAGLWGGVTVHKRIAFVQALPAVIALVLYLI